MTVEELITALKKCEHDKVVVLTEPDGIGWSNIARLIDIGRLIDDVSVIKLTMDNNTLFDN